MKQLFFYAAGSAILIASLYAQANTYEVFTKEGATKFDNPSDTIKYIWGHEGRILRVVETRPVKLGKDLKFRTSKALAVK